MLLEIENNLVIESLKVNFAKELFELVDKNRRRLKQFLSWLNNIKSEEDELILLKSKIIRL